MFAKTTVRGVSAAFHLMAALVTALWRAPLGLHPTTVSLLEGGCLPYDPDPGRRAYDPETKTYIGGYQGLSRNRVEGRKQHYQDVAKEFISFGRARLQRTVLSAVPRTPMESPQ